MSDEAPLLRRVVMRAALAALFLLLTAAPAVNCPGPGKIARLEPETLREIGSEEYEGPHTGHIAVGEREVWLTVPPGELVAVDRASGEVTKRVELVDMQIADDVEAGPEAIWASTFDGQILKVDPARARLVATRRLGRHRGFDLDAGGEGVWVADGTAGTLILLDPTSLRTKRRFRLGGQRFDPRQGRAYGELAVDLGPRILWVADLRHSRLLAVDRATRRRRGSVPLPAPPVDLAVGPASVWVVAADGSLLQVDRIARRVVRRQPLGVLPSHVVAGGDAVFVTSFRHNALLRYEPTTGELQRKEVAEASDAAVAPEALWLNYGANPVED